MFAHVQQEESRQAKQVALPCNSLCCAAGLQGLRLQEASCCKLALAATAMLKGAGLPDRIMAALQCSITHSNIAATAMKVLQMPELLYLPAAFRAHCAGTYDTHRHGDIEQVLLRLCFVCTPKIHVNYCDAYDVEEKECHQVCSGGRLAKDTSTAEAAASAGQAKMRSGEARFLTDVNVQATFMNTPSKLNFFITSTAEVGEESGNGQAAKKEDYASTIQALMAGSWMLPQSKWVFLLCTAMTVLICDPDNSTLPYSEFFVKEEYTVGGSAKCSTTSQVCLVRWCHRITPDALRTPRQRSARTDPDHLIDPMATLFGCERLVWARCQEVSAKGSDKLAGTIVREIKRIYSKGSSAAGSAGAKRPRQVDVGTGRAALDRFASGRYRADDAFAGKAYCDVLSTRVTATPVAVLPAFQTARHDRQALTMAPGRASSDYRGFTKCQGYRLSGYSQFRLNLFAQAREQ